MSDVFAATMRQHQRAQRKAVTRVFQWGCGGLMAFFSLIGVFIGAWATHVITCITHHEWGLLIAGAIGFPIGIVHGIGIWFGVWAS